MLLEAMTHYQTIGYKPLPVPYLVDKDIVDLTMPKGRYSKSHLDKYYVGSAEQSFYQMIKNGMCPSGSYMMLTPCQRYEDVLDDSHLEIFLKLELVSTERDYAQICNDVDRFYSFRGFMSEVISINFGESFDININGIEVGSFGSRCFESHVINYGTGLALPRISQATGDRI